MLSWFEFQIKLKKKEKLKRLSWRITWWAFLSSEKVTLSESIKKLRCLFDYQNTTETVVKYQNCFSAFWKWRKHFNASRNSNTSTLQNSTQYKNLIEKKKILKPRRKKSYEKMLTEKPQWRSMREGERTENWARIIKEAEFWRL